jgi:hypothetical protein
MERSDLLHRVDLTRRMKELIELQPRTKLKVWRGGICIIRQLYICLIV